MVIVGHRGACGLAPENTIASFTSALKAKVDMIEFDVVVTGDKIPVICHDPFLASPSGAIAIKSTDLSNLKQLKPDLITLDEALDFINAQVIAYVEIKPETELTPVIKVLKKHLGNYGPDKLYIASFQQKLLVRLHEALPEQPIIVLENLSSVRALIRAKRLKTPNVSLNKRLLYPGFLRVASKLGWNVYAYTINDPGKARRMAAHGLYGVITDYPNRFNVD